jgi:hypothetical protein
MNGITQIAHQNPPWIEIPPSLVPQATVTVTCQQLTNLAKSETKARLVGLLGHTLSGTFLLVSTWIFAELVKPLSLFLLAPKDAKG